MLGATGSWGMSRKKAELRARNWTLYRSNLNDQGAACEARSRDELKSFVASLKRPDLVPRVFGYHELFHALVIGAALCQYAAIAFFVLPR